MRSASFRATATHAIAFPTDRKAKTGPFARSIMLDDVLKRPGQEVEIEDILGAALIMPGLEAVLGRALQFDQGDRPLSQEPAESD